MNIRIRHIIAAVCIAAGGHSVWAQVNFGANEIASVAVDSHEAQVVNTALSLLERDYKAIFSDSLRHDSDAPKIIIGTVGESGRMAPYGHITKMLAGRSQAFMLKVLPDNRLLIAGSDSHGTAYGIMELSRLIGVSPWEWWADATPAKKENFTLPADYETVQSPSVEYRGIFINDEDWALHSGQETPMNPAANTDSPKSARRPTKRFSS